VIEEKIEIRTADGMSEGFLYLPDGAGPWPGVIYFTDIGGIRPVYEDKAKRLATQGYTVLLPNVFYRTGKLPVVDFPLKFGEERTTKRLAELSGPLTPEAISRDVSDYVDFLAKQPSVKPGGMGVVGYCFTGKMALYAASARPDRIAAAASFHAGGLATDAPNSPHLVLSKAFTARLYFGHAIDDKSMPAAAIDKLNSALKAWGGQYESEVYEGAYHSWTVPGSPVYNQPQAERAFEKLTDLFSQALQ
jgi:carboxymethylenebutenolidase